MKKGHGSRTLRYTSQSPHNAPTEAVSLVNDPTKVYVDQAEPLSLRDASQCFVVLLLPHLQALILGFAILDIYTVGHRNPTFKEIREGENFKRIGQGQ
ncbi:unnamed protein product [Sphenostylis stenocarpa]|uniref:Uncharacterized protein n=1 Tax=Sphenostylis stenocarpa TaxID=92480 RepID=A0AA86SI04_9FABA|nr:unnamed protein product [Sphenostylis stenocarpa]